MRIAISLLLSLAVAQANAFEAWGYRSGMSEDEASAVARRDGYKVHESGIPPTRRFHTLVFEPSDARAGLVYFASFCEGRLTWVSHDYHANIGTLFEVVNDLKTKYGAPTVEPTSTMLADGRARALDIKFPPKVDDVVYIAVNLTMNSDTAFGIQVIHHNTDMKCQ